jgi:hypothetical protein
MTTYKEKMYIFHDDLSRPSKVYLMQYIGTLFDQRSVSNLRIEDYGHYDFYHSEFPSPNHLIQSDDGNENNKTLAKEARLPSV